jgi:ATP-binding cassette subfamily B protein
VIDKDQSDSKPQRANWSERLRALRRVPPIFRMVWACAPTVVAFSIVARLIVSVIPVGMLWVTRLIIDAIVKHTSAHAALPQNFWKLVALEFALASAAAILGRAIGYF